MVTSIDGEGVDLTEIDLSQKNPAPEDDNKIYKHNGKGTITLVDGTTSSEDNYYAWDEPQGAWRRLTTSENPNFDSALIRDDGKLKFGTDADYSIRYDSSKNKLVVADEQDSVDALQVTDAGDVEIPNGRLRASVGLEGDSGVLRQDFLSSETRLHTHSTDGINVVFRENDGGFDVARVVASGSTPATFELTNADLQFGGNHSIHNGQNESVLRMNNADTFLDAGGSNRITAQGSGPTTFKGEGIEIVNDSSSVGDGAKINMPGGSGDLTESVQGGHGRSARTWNAEYDSANNTWVQPNGSTEPSAIIGMLNTDGGGVGTSEGNVGIGVAPASGTDGASISFTNVLYAREAGRIELPSADGSNDSIRIAGHLKFDGSVTSNPVIRTPGGSTDSVRIYDDYNATTMARFNEGGPIKFPHHDVRIGTGMTLENDVDININATTNQGSSGGAGAITNIGRLNFTNEEEAQFTESAEIIYDASQGFVFNDIVDLRNANRMKLPSTSSDPTADAGDMWYRSDLD